MQVNLNSVFKTKSSLIIAAFFVVLSGVGVAWMINAKVIQKGNVSVSAPGTKVTKTSAGALDPNIEYQNVVGTLKEGGAGNEGTHHLERDGGPSRYVYLTSSVIDLQGFVGQKVEVWGETLSSKQAGWLMDVAKIQEAN